MAADCVAASSVAACEFRGRSGAGGLVSDERSEAVTLGARAARRPCDELMHGRDSAAMAPPTPLPQCKAPRRP